MGKIKIYTNESVDVAIPEGLKRRGVDAFSARDKGNLGLTDQEQLVYASNKEAAVFTHDSDFLKIAARWMKDGRTHHGIIYCHQTSYSIGECVRKLRALTSLLTSADMINHIEFL
jgi:predicted nuclease of predicted toxin-antitoxin system